RRLVHEPADQPRARNPVNVGVLPGHPLHGCSPCMTFLDPTSVSLVTFYRSDRRRSRLDACSAANGTMIPCWQAASAGLLTGSLAAILIRLASWRGRRVGAAVIAAGAGSAALGALAWNAVLHATAASQFFVDLPFRPFPVSWQDIGSGVFALAL